MMICNQCPKNCKVNRNEPNLTGLCGMPYNPVIAKVMLHMWEEPCISGTKGSGTIFFSGCNLHCVYCQNYDISTRNIGKEISKEKLIEYIFKLIDMGAHNINFVNPTHYAHILTDILKEYKDKITVPIIYNTSGYDSLETLKKLEGLIDIYLPDFKYFDNEIALKYSGVNDYKEIVIRNLEEMYKQVGNSVFDEAGLIKKGLIIRHLILPNNIKNTLSVIDWYKGGMKNNAILSIMSQYIPYGKAYKYDEINRKINKIEYNRVIKYLLDNDLEDVYCQELSSANTKFIPNFLEEDLI